MLKQGEVCGSFDCHLRNMAGLEFIFLLLLSYLIILFYFLFNTVCHHPRQHSRVNYGNEFVHIYLRMEVIDFHLRTLNCFREQTTTGHTWRVHTLLIPPPTHHSPAKKCLFFKTYPFTARFNGGFSFFTKTTKED